MSTTTAVRLDLPPIEELELIRELAITTHGRLNDIKESLEGHAKRHDDSSQTLGPDSLDEAAVGRLLLFAHEQRDMGRYIEQQARLIEEEAVGLYERAHERQTTSDRLRLLGLVEGYAQEEREYLEAK